MDSNQLFEMEAQRITLADRFGFVPFSVFNTREGEWQKRKQRWLSLGLKSEVGRGSNLLNFSATASLGAEEGATSIFDPVLCELAYRWWAPTEANILDPFAGGSVRGIVASHLGHRYTGVDLSFDQIKANHDNLAEIGPGQHPPKWVAGDSRSIISLAGAGAPYNMLMTCPPYADLEVYSDHPADISALDYPEFLDAYRTILHRAASLLERDSFLVIVVSEVRDKQGRYRGLVPDTTRIMHEAECWLYNEAILVNAVGTLAVRASRNFPPGRKLGRSHQNVLVYVKGDGMAAARKCAPLETD